MQTVINQTVELYNTIIDPLTNDFTTTVEVENTEFITIINEEINVDLTYIPSPTQGEVDSGLGASAIITLATNVNAGLLSPLDKVKIDTFSTFSGNYEDLTNVPSTFPPNAHTHVEADITDLDKYSQLQTDTLLNAKFNNPTGNNTEYLDGAGVPTTFPTIPSISGLATTSYVDSQDNLKVDKVAGKSLIDNTELVRLSTVTNFDNSGNITALANKVDKIPGKGLSTEDYTTTEKSKLTGIEAGAEVNNITDADATDLTDGGDTTLHNHDSRYYTEIEVDSLLSDKFDNPTGTASEYLDGTGTPQTFPSIPNIIGLATETYVDSQDALKVDKVPGKGLSTEDYSTSEKNKLASITEIFTTVLKNAYDSAVIIAHSHSNKTLLDTYTQTEIDLADAISKKHTHSNIAILNNISEAFTTALKTSYDNSVLNSHTHSNKSVLDNINEAFTTSLKSAYDTTDTNLTNLLVTGNRLITSAEITKLSNTNGSNTGDETQSTIQTKRPLKTINGSSLEGSGNIVISGGTTTWIDLVVRPSILHSTISNGTIRKHSKVGFTDVYRFIPSIYTAENDAFYEDVNLTILIVKRG